MKLQFNPNLLDRLRTNDPTLVELDLTSSGITDEQVVLLCQALEQNTTLKSLNLCHNQIGDTGASALAQNVTLTSLHLSVNNIGDAGATTLAQNTTLASLSLGWNEIGAAGVDALTQNKTLTSLNLWFNGVDCGGNFAWIQNTTPESVNYYWGPNELDDAGAVTLAQNTVLTSLSPLIYNAGDVALAQNTMLTSLGLSGNNIGDAGPIALAPNTTLEWLGLDAGPTALAPNTTLEWLGLDAGPTALAPNTTLEWLGLIDDPARIAMECRDNFLQSRAQLPNLFYRVFNNHTQQGHRKQQWLNIVVMLAADTVDPQSTSPWSKLPPELACKILSYPIFSDKAPIAKDRLQFYYAARYILEHISTIQAAAKQHQRFTLVEHTDAPLPSAHRFSLEFQPTAPAPLARGKQKLTG